MGATKGYSINSNLHIPQLIGISVFSNHKYVDNNAIFNWNFVSKYFCTLLFQVVLMLFFSEIHLQSAAGVQANGITFVSEFHTSATGPRAASFASMFMPAVFIYMSTIAIFIVPMEWSVWIGSLNFTPWRLFLICCSSINILNFIFISILPESPKFQLLMNEKDDALKTLRRMYAANTGKSPDDFPVHDLIPVSSGRNLSEVKGVKNAIQFVWKQTKPVFVAPFLDKTVKLSYLMFVIFSIGHGSYMWYNKAIFTSDNQILKNRILFFQVP